MLRIAQFIPVALLLVAVAAPAANAESAQSGRVAQERQACGQLGLDPSEAPFADCMRSMAQTLAQLDQSNMVERNRSTCAKEGLEPGTSAFAVCVVKLEQSPSGGFASATAQ